MTTEERGQEEQERRQKKRIKRILLPLLALWLAVQLGKCVYREEKRRLGYAHAVEEYMNRKYRKFGDRFHFKSESKDSIRSPYEVELTSDHYPYGSLFHGAVILRDSWIEEDAFQHKDNYMGFVFWKERVALYEPFFDEAFGVGNYTVTGGVLPLPDWQLYGPDTEIEEYLDTDEGLSITLDVRSDFTKSKEAMEILRKRMAERNWGLDLYISYFDQAGNKIAFDWLDINIYSSERVKLDWAFENSEMKERWKHVSSGT